jgi:hypothetical protein
VVKLICGVTKLYSSGIWQQEQARACEKFYWLSSEHALHLS